jgi:hypothetical protein
MVRFSFLLVTKYKQKQWLGLAWLDDDDAEEFLSRGSWFKGRQCRSK